MLVRPTGTPLRSLSNPSLFPAEQDKSCPPGKTKGVSRSRIEPEPPEGGEGRAGPHSGRTFQARRNGKPSFARASPGTPIAGDRGQRPPIVADSTQP